MCCRPHYRGGRVGKGQDRKAKTKPDEAFQIFVAATFELRGQLSKTLCSAEQQQQRRDTLDSFLKHRPFRFDGQKRKPSLPLSSYTSDLSENSTLRCLLSTPPSRSQLWFLSVLLCQQAKESFASELKWSLRLLTRLYATQNLI